MKRGRLTLQEKFAIQGMCYHKKTVKEISNILGRSEVSIQKYIDTELDKTVKGIVKSALTNDEIAKGLEKDLAKAHKTIEKKERVIKELKSQLPSKPKNKSKTTMKDLMTHKKPNEDEPNKKNNITIMTEAASQLADEFKKNMPKTKSRSIKGHIFNMETGKIE